MTKTIAAIILVLAMTACSKGKKKDPGVLIEAETAVLEEVVAEEKTDPYTPVGTKTKKREIPAFVTDPQDRIDYSAQLYWDDLNFRDPAVTEDIEMLSSRFNDFISLLNQCSRDAIRQAAIRECFKQAAVSPTTFQYFSRMAEERLYNRESPYLDENLYTLFINNLLASHLPTEAQKNELRQRRDDINHGAPGTHALELNIKFRDGSATRLTQLFSNVNTLVIFYASDNDHDKENIHKLTECQNLAESVENSRLQIILLNTSDSLSIDAPPMWISASCPDVGRTYIRRTHPSAYIFDHNGTILQKDKSVSEILAMF